MLPQRSLSLEVRKRSKLCLYTEMNKVDLRQHRLAKIVSAKMINNDAFLEVDDVYIICKYFINV